MAARSGSSCRRPSGGWHESIVRFGGRAARGDDRKDSLRRRHHQDRGDLPADRQRGQRRLVRQGRGRARSGHRQHRASRARGPSARRDRRAAQSRRRENRAHQRRPPGQSAGRPEPDLAADHARQGRGHARRLPFLRRTGGDGGRRAPGHSFSRGRFGRAQYYRPRLQMDFPHRTDRIRLRQRLHPIPQRPEEGRAQDRHDCHRQRKHGLRHIRRRLNRRGTARTSPARFSSSSN